MSEKEAGALSRFATNLRLVGGDMVGRAGALVAREGRGLRELGQGARAAAGSARSAIARSAGSGLRRAGSSALSGAKGVATTMAKNPVTTALGVGSIYMAGRSAKDAFTQAKQQVSPTLRPVRPTHRPVNPARSFQGVYQYKGAAMSDKHAGLNTANAAKASALFNWIKGLPADQAEALLRQIKKNFVAPPTPMNDRLQKGLIDAAIGTAALTGATGLVAAGDAAVKHIKGKLKARSSYNRLLEKNPQLSDTPEVQDAFSVLNTYAPDVAAEPITAGSFVSQVVDYGAGVHPKQVKELVDIQSRMTGASPYHHPVSSRFTDQFIGGFGKEAESTRRRAQLKMARALGSRLR